MTRRPPLTPRTEPVGPDGLTLRERSWLQQAEAHVRQLNALLGERGSAVRFTFPALQHQPAGDPPASPKEAEQ